MNPVDHAEVFETVTIGGVTWSGTCEIAGLAYEMGWDVQDAKGANGASLARVGRKLSKFTLRFNMVLDQQQGIDQFEEWYVSVLPVLKSSFAGKDPVGLLIEHPDCQALEVESVVVEKISAVAHDYAGGGYADVSVIQFAPAKKVSTKGPGGSKGSNKGGGGAGATDPNDPVQQRIDTLDELLSGP